MPILSKRKKKNFKYCINFTYFIACFTCSEEENLTILLFTKTEFFSFSFLVMSFFLSISKTFTDIEL